MFSPRRFAFAVTATGCLSALAAFVLADTEFPASTCGQANCANCMQGKRNDCPLCCKGAPGYIDDNHPAICYSMQNLNSSAAVGAWCITAGSATQGCSSGPTFDQNGRTPCGSVHLWHCGLCITADANCVACPCDPATWDKNMNFPVGMTTVICTDYAIAQ